MPCKPSLHRVVALLGILLFPCLVYAATYTVGCPGGTGGTYTSINSVLPLLMPGDVVLVSGTCTENVTFEAMNRISLVGSPSANLAGYLLISDSSLIYVAGLNVTSATGYGIAVESSRDIAFDTCTSNGNASAGMFVENTSDAYIFPSGSFDNNGNAGIYSDSNSFVGLFAFGGGTIDISNNVSAGISCFGCVLGAFGNVTITGNKAETGSLAVSGFGVDLRGAARGQFAAANGPNLVQLNQSGGVSLQENSEISFYGGALIPGGQLNIIQNNGPVGVVVSYGSQATFFEGVRVLNHTEVGVDVYGHSQAYFHGDNKIDWNATGSAPSRAGLRVDGDSETLLRGSEFSNNGGPAILALVNSSVDFANLVFGQNQGGSVVCDSSSYMASDLTKPQQNPSHGIYCQSPHNFGNHRDYTMGAPHIPDVSRLKARHDYYQKLIAKH
jgi:hypothetical protein